LLDRQTAPTYIVVLFAIIPHWAGLWHMRCRQTA